MVILDDITSIKPLSSVQRPDVIEYQTEYIPNDIFVVYDIDNAIDITAVLVQLWKFEGGYDHGIYSIVENDLQINKSVKILIPIKHKIVIEKIISYRLELSDLSEKEIFIMDLKPKSLRSEIIDEYYIPYECMVIINGTEKILNLPSWTPIQKLPFEQIKKGSILEIWEVKNKFSIMKVLKI